MNKVITINLGGNAYQLEEGGYDALRSYLDAAHRRLEGNPDRDEIIADIEQAIADKIRGRLGPGKTVCSGKEVTAIIAEMGPVEDGSGAASPASDSGAAPRPSAGPAPEPAPAAPKRLYKIREGAIVSGVCTGLAAYFNLDVTIVRLLVAILCFFYGAGILFYILMAIILPSATTPAEKAAAHGTAAATAQEFIRRAREGYYEGLKTMGDRHAHRAWRRRFKADMREMRRTVRWQMRFRGPFGWHGWNEPGTPQPAPAASWVLLPLAGLLTGLLTLAGLAALFSLLSSGALFGIALPAGMPLWAAIVLLIVAINLARWPLKEMRRAYYYHGGYGPCWGGPIGFVWHLAVWLAIAYFVYWLVKDGNTGDLNETLHLIAQKLHHAALALKQWWQQL
jgi:phage shock protein PspC (stress-responsive transcriptional regulator)